VTPGVAEVHADRFGVKRPEILDRLADGGQLGRSARGLVLRVEQQQGPPPAIQVTEPERVPPGTAQRKIWCHIPDIDHRLVLPVIRIARPGPCPPGEFAQTAARAVSDCTGLVPLVL